MSTIADSLLGTGHAGRILVYGHRGASAEVPENTLEAFQRALDLGVDGIELDVHATLDGVPVVLHDRDLSRTMDVAANIDRLTLAEVEAIVGPRGARIPSLADVVKLVDGRAHLDVEVKQGGIEAPLLAVLAHAPRDRWAISSFDWSVLSRVRKLDANADLWLLTTHVSDAALATIDDLGCSAVAIFAGSYSNDVAARLAQVGVPAVVWTVNDPALVLVMAARGAASICTDDPRAIIAAVRSGAT